MKFLMMGKTGMVFPADAGVIPELKNVLTFKLSIPRGCGGDPRIKRGLNKGHKYSPRMRG